MEKLKYLEERMYLSRLHISLKHFYETLAQLKEDKSLLEEAISTVKDRETGLWSVKAPCICDAIITDAGNIDEEIYHKLINLIYSNPDVARTTIVNHLDSFLLMTLQNPSLKLTEEQKAFAVNEALNCPGTIKNPDEPKQETTSHQTCPEEYNRSKIALQSTKHPCYLSNVDIRYHILRNNNWSTEEKKELLEKFYATDEIYQEALDNWELHLVSCSGFRTFISKQWMYDMTQEDLRKVTLSKETTDKVWSNIEFLKQMRRLRDPEHFLENKESSKKKI